MSKKISGKSGKTKTPEKKAAPQRMAAAKPVKPAASVKQPAKKAVVPAKAAPEKITPTKAGHTKSVPAQGDVLADKKTPGLPRGFF